MIKVYIQPNNVETTSENWWFAFDEDNNIIINPQCCSGFTSGPLTMVVADTLEECEDYIKENNLVYNKYEDIIME